MTFTLAPTIDATTLTKAQRGILLYAETCLVDHGGLLEGVRMNGEDMNSLAAFQVDGLLTYGRIPGRLLAVTHARQRREATHWVTFTDQAWELVAKLRRMRAENQASPSRKAIDSWIAEREAANAIED